MNMALLQDILYKVRISAVLGSTQTEISDIQIDSRKVISGSCFIAIRGSLQDGHDHVQQAIEKGAGVVVCEQLPAATLDKITYVVTPDTALAAGIMANAFFGEPSSKLRLVGITGTNGKTTVATLLYKLFTGLQFKCGLVSTVNYMIGTEGLPSTHTTPDAITLHGLLRKMVDAGCGYVFMEVSSHAVHQQRISGLQFSGAVFTNITHDHLDYHKTFDEYIRVKKSFFDGLPTSAFAISNLDDRNGAVMLQNTGAAKFYYSLKTVADVKGRIIDDSITGLQMLVNEQDVHFRLMGTFNAYNLMAVFAAAMCLGQDKQEVLRVMSALTGAEGRFEVMVSEKKNVIGIVDYAHTPDALENVIKTINDIRGNHAQLITVVGCGGNRDAAKRPEMGKIAARLSSKVIFTSDNPRNEDPETIIQQMEAGVEGQYYKKLLKITDRNEAIRTAVMLAAPGDVILIAGKGHETYQEIKGVKHPFDDKAIVRSILNQNNE